MTGERIAVTGVGMVSPLGHDAKSTFAAVCAGQCAIAPVTLFDTRGYRSGIAAEVRGLSVEDIAGRSDAWSRADALAVVAARAALADAGISAGAAAFGGTRAGLGIAVGATAAGMFETERPLLDSAGVLSRDVCQAFASRPLSDVAARVRSAIGGGGPSSTICCACSSGAVSLVQGAAWIRAGQCDRVLAGGVDALCQLTFAGFNALCALDIDPCRPFDASRNGLSLGEGSAFLVLERESSARSRGARVLAWLAGWGVGSEAHHITRPEPSGATAARLLEAALSSAGLDAREIAYVNAHGTGTVHNDSMEAAALRRVFGERTSTLPVSSSKGSIGHTLGAAGAIEAVLTVLTIERGAIPASVGCSEVDVELALDVASTTIERPVRAALSTSFGFGGAGCVLAFTGAANPPPIGHAGSARPRVVVTSWAGSQFSADENLAGAIAEIGSVPAGKTRRFDRRAQTGLFGVAGLVHDVVDGADAGLVIGTAHGSLHRSSHFLADLSTKGPRRVSPAEFPHLLPSAAAGNISIALGLRGPVLTVLDGESSSEAALASATSMLELGLAPRMIAGASQTHDAAIALAGNEGSTSANANANANDSDPDSPTVDDEHGAWLQVEAESHAIGRGARIHAWLTAVLTTDTDDDADVADQLARSPCLQNPRAVERSVVLVSGARTASAFARMLEPTGWRSVPLRSLPFDTGTREAAGLRLVASALDSLARREVDEALICTRGCGKRSVWHLAARTRGSAGAYEE